MGGPGTPPQGELVITPGRTVKQKPRGLVGSRGEKIRRRSNYFFANTCFATCALARLAALRCTTPDLTALSMAEA